MARYEFYRYHGQWFIDLSRNRFHALNGDDLIYESTKDMKSVADRGIYGDGDVHKYVRTPPHNQLGMGAPAQQLKLPETFTASFLVKIITTGLIYSKHEGTEKFFVVKVDEVISSSDLEIVVYMKFGNTLQVTSATTSLLATCQWTWIHVEVAYSVDDDETDITIFVGDVEVNEDDFDGQFNDVSATSAAGFQEAVAGYFGANDANSLHGFIAIAQFSEAIFSGSSEAPPDLSTCDDPTRPTDCSTPPICSSLSHNFAGFGTNCNPCDETTYSCNIDKQESCYADIDSSGITSLECVSSHTNVCDHSNWYVCNSVITSYCFEWLDSRLSPCAQGFCPVDWVSNYYYDSSSWNCLGCDLTWATCDEGSNLDCVTCQNDARHEPGAGTSGTCTWDAGNFMANDGSWKAWDGSCAACSGETDTQCLSCYPDATVATASIHTGKCMCDHTVVDTQSTGDGTCPPDTWSSTRDVSFCDSCDGYVWNPAFTPSCITCSPSCKKCEAHSTNQCTDCYANADLIQDNCECQAGYVFQTDLCVQCGEQCLTCQSSNPRVCLTCVGNASLDSQNSCSCDEHWVPNANTCVECELECKDCQDARGLGVCTSCYADASLSTANSCICDDGFYPDSHSASCSACEDSCATCDNATSCLTCLSGTPLETGLCVTCEDHQFYSELSGACQPCLFYCGTCSDSTSCLTWQDDSVALTGHCCSEKHYRNSLGECHECPQLWAQWESSDICSACVDHAEIFQSSWECQSGFHLFEGGCHEDAAAPVLSISANGANELTLTFDKEIFQTLSEQNVILTFEGINEEDYTYTLEEIEPGKEFLLQFEFDDPDENQNAKFELSFDAEITDLAGNVASKDQFETQIENANVQRQEMQNEEEVEMSRNNEELSESEEDVKSGTVALTQTIAMGSLATGFLTGDLTSTWSFINTIQILAFIPLMDSQNMSPLLSETLTGLLEFEIVPNFFEYILNEEDFKGQEPYDFAQDYDFENNVFLINCGGLFSNTFVLLCILPVAIAFSFCKNTKIQDYFKRKISEYKWGFFLRAGIEMHLEVGIAAYLQCMTPRYDNASLAVNTILGYFFIITTFVSTPITLIFLYKNRAKILVSDEKFSKVYGSLSEEFKNDRGTMSIMFYVWFFLRRSIYILTIIALRHYFAAQMMINIMHSLLSMVFLIRYMPYQERRVNIVAIYSEFTTGVIFALAASFHLDVEEGTAKALQWSAIGILYSIILLNLLLWLFPIITKIYEYCLKLSTSVANKGKVNKIAAAAMEDTQVIFEDASIPTQPNKEEKQKRRLSKLIHRKIEPLAQVPAFIRRPSRVITLPPYLQRAPITRQGIKEYN